jgi:hypothetical protein
VGKCLYIDGSDYAACRFEDEFEGNKLELWNKSIKEGKLEYDDGDFGFDYEALEMDDATVEEIQERMDYDDSKHANYIKVEE